MQTKLELLPLTAIATDRALQPRAQLDDAAVLRYAEDMAAGLWDFGASSTPITVFYDNETYWLADGYHRVAAAKKAKRARVEAEIRQGDQRDALLFSVGANATHEHPRSNEDKRRAVSRLLNDPDWAKWSDRKIAKACSVAPTFVGKVRASLSTVDSERTYTTKHGTVATMDTSAIGKASALPPCVPEEAAQADGEGHHDPAREIVTVALLKPEAEPPERAVTVYPADVPLRQLLDNRPRTPPEHAANEVPEEDIQRRHDQARAFGDWLDGFVRRLRARLSETRH